MNPRDMVSTSAPDVSPDTDGRFCFADQSRIVANPNPPTEHLKGTQFQPGNPGGPGQTPARIPAFFRALTEADGDDEVKRLVAQGMRNPVIAAKLRAIQSADEDLANKASEQLVDRVFGRARQTVEHAGELSVSVSLLDALKNASDQA